MPHVCGDEPYNAIPPMLVDIVCPTYVGMNLQIVFQEMALQEYAPRMWG